MKVWRFLSLAVLLAMGIAGCAPSAAPTALVPTIPSGAPTSPPSAPTEALVATNTPASATPADTLVYVADISDLITFDPAVAFEPSAYTVMQATYETLLRFDGADLSTVRPGLAEKWEIADAGDHWEVTFNLRPDAKFASGNPVTSDDVVYSVQRLISLNKTPANLLTVNAQLTVDSVKAVDAKTVMFTLPKDSSPQAFLSIVASTNPEIVDSKEVKAHETDGDFGSAWLQDKSAGSGPYMVDHWTTESEVLLVANPNYYGTKPALDKILIKHVPEATNQQTMLERGDADFARNLSPEQIASLQGKEGIKTAKGDSLILVYVGMNASFKPLDNPKVREALRAAIDYDGIVNDLLSGNATKVQDIIPLGLFGANPDTPFQQDIEGAKALLKEAGLEQGFSIDLLTAPIPMPGGTTGPDLAAKLQADWAKIGVTVNVKQVAPVELLGTYRDQKHQLVLIYWGPEFPDPDANVPHFTDYDLETLAWRNAWKDPISVKAHEAALMTDPVQRAAAYKDITEYVMHNGPYAVLYQSSELFAMRSNVNGFVWNPLGWEELWNVSK
jgi:peptide/nickel transport system substrate-binding protein